MEVQLHPPKHVEQNKKMDGSSEQAAKMLIFLQNGEQRIIKFTLPKESCTLQEVLKQVSMIKQSLDKSDFISAIRNECRFQINIPFSEDTNIQFMQNISTEIDYFVSVGSTTAIEEMLKYHPMFVGDLGSRRSPSLLSQPQSSSISEMATPEKLNSSDGVLESPDTPRKSPPPKFVDGMLAICKTCGYTGLDFNKCQRCKRVFTEEPKSVPIASRKDLKKKDLERQNLLKKPLVLDEDIKLNLLKTPIRTLNSKATRSTLAPLNKKATKRKASIIDNQIKFMNVRTEALKNTEMTDFEAFSVSVTRKLERMDPIQALHAETIIHKALRKGLLNQLTENTDICDNQCNMVSISKIPNTSRATNSSVSNTQEHIIPPNVSPSSGTQIINLNKDESESILRDYFTQYKDF